ncbi:cytochrome oxidase [Blattabacterium cuenoti]|uniref:cytochrome oxidase n=1 Tax=Blattabacterium cuenoti TaxID=1653831 RepID=UPI00163C38A4|nr:cytochrome oxidase [Blattabacterium cuenoti]
MISFLKHYFKGEKNIGIFQSIMLILFFLFFSLILFFIFSKPKKYYEEISFLPLNDRKKQKDL